MKEIEHGVSRYASKRYKCRCDICRQASVEYQRQRRLNKPEALAKTLEGNRQYRKRVAEHVRKLKDKPCADCKIKYPYYVMQFDHLGEELKTAGIAQLRTIAAIDIEVKKCEVVCANCHAERTQKRLDKDM